MTADEQSPPESKSYPVSPGALLKAAREKANLSQRDVVAETRMTLLKVRALEEDDYETLQSDTFVRGYLRIYAKMLNLDPSPLLEAYQQARRAMGLEEETDEAAFQVPVPPSRPIWHYAALVALVLAGVLAASIWLFSGAEIPAPSVGADEEPEPGLVSSATASEPEFDPEASQELVAEQASLATEQPAPEQERVEPTNAALSAAANPVDEPPALDRLGLSFDEECWLVVTDAKGDVLHTELVQPDSEVDVRGQAPFEVTLGNASAATLSLNGEPFDLEVPPGRRVMTISVGE